MLSSSSFWKDSDVGFLCTFLAQLWVLGSPNQRAIWGEGDWILFCFGVLPSTQPQLNTDRFPLQEAANYILPTYSGCFTVFLQV